MRKRYPLLIYDSLGQRMTLWCTPVTILGGIFVAVDRFFSPLPALGWIGIGAAAIGLIGIVLAQFWVRQAAVFVEKDRLIVQEPHRRTSIPYSNIHRFEPERLSDRYSGQNISVVYLQWVRAHYRSYGLSLRLRQSLPRSVPVFRGRARFRHLLFLSDQEILLVVPDWSKLLRIIDRVKNERVPKQAQPRSLVQETMGRIIGPESAPLLIVAHESEAIHKQLQQILARRYQVLSASDGTEALRYIRDRDPVLVILGENLPRLSGQEVLATLQRTPRLSRLPVFYISNTPSPGLFSAGVKDILKRPFEPEDILGRVANWLAVQDEIRDLKSANHQLEERALDQMSELMKRGELINFLPSQVAENVLSGELVDRRTRLQKRTVTVLFVDLVGFTALSGRLSPEILSAMINEYLNEMSSAAIKNHGTIDKFIGDEVMVLFGAPDAVDEETQVRRAVQAAMDMMARIDALSTRWSARVGQPLQVRIGFNTGIGTAGVFGQKGLQSYTVVGPVVNIAARLRGAAAPGQIVCSRQSFQWIHRSAEGRSMGRLELKGVAIPVEGVVVTGLEWQPV